ncbi:disulfide oxidoreductase [Pseudalkalibacillus caeni]|uniref:Disulfide bond formation protein B n=1 Tax=Exobacillus caeni TaxID=2574798 RepID=A0A5R9FB67_9BACL|nr:disulfide oxidoreductase [Pseudalkalibacillus caeni]TLS36865.1 disulfide bond formation protein B [Pseudalkalibacillus caeni]
MNRTLLLAWITAIVAVLGSLSFSELLHFVPCTLCWYQRVLMYPLAFILGIAFFYNEQSVYRYVLPFSVIGMILSVYHYTLQKVPAFKKFESCTSGVPCSGEYINWAGFITIPLLAFICFTIITLSMGLLYKQRKP